MNPEISRMVGNRHERARGMVSAALKNADYVAGLMDWCYCVQCAGELPPDWSAIQTFAGHQVDRLRVDLLRADSRQVAAQGDARRLRRRRDDSSRRLHRNLTHIRSVFDVAYGAGSCAHLLGLVPGMSRKPAAVFRLAERAADRMRDPEIDLPLPALTSVRLDLGQLFGAIESDLAILGRALEDLQECQRRLRRATDIKRSAMRRFDHEIRPWTRLLEALYELSGDEALAAELKPPARRRRPR